MVRAIRVRVRVRLRNRVNLWLWSSLVQKCANCACAISKLRSTFCKLRIAYWKSRVAHGYRKACCVTSGDFYRNCRNEQNRMQRYSDINDRLLWIRRLLATVPAHVHLRRGWFQGRRLVLSLQLFLVPVSQSFKPYCSLKYTMWPLPFYPLTFTSLL